MVRLSFPLVLTALFLPSWVAPSPLPYRAFDIHPRDLHPRLHSRAHQVQLKAAPDADGDPSYSPPSPDPGLPLDRLPDARPQVSKRRFISKLVDTEIERVSTRIADPALRRIFQNTYPNTLDTTVGWADLDYSNALPDAFPRAFIITGDISASWLRDSTSQINPYLDLLKDPPSGFTEGDKDWEKLYRLALGLVYQQSQFVLASPFSNSFGAPLSATISKPTNYNSDSVSPTSQGKVEGTDGVSLWESKWEGDSLANFFRHSVSLWQATGRQDFVKNPTWQRAVRLAIDTLRSQQRGSDEEHAANMSRDRSVPPGVISSDGEWEQRYGGSGGGVYKFQRNTRTSTETRSDGGFGEPGKRNGLVKSAFRPSDDATMLPFLIPSNALLAVSLEGISELLANVTSMRDVASNAHSFAAEIRAAITEHAIQPHKAVKGVFDAGDVYAYEVDGYGSTYFMDDANVPSLLSLPYLGYVKASDPTYQRTRALVLSPETNKWAFSGTAGSGIGGPHVGWGYSWPMSRITQILTSNDTAEIVDALKYLRASTAGTGLMHEGVSVNNSNDFTRPWFAWVNGLFGEAIRKLEKDGSPALGMKF